MKVDLQIQIKKAGIIAKACDKNYSWSPSLYSNTHLLFIEYKLIKFPQSGLSKQVNSCFVRLPNYYLPRLETSCNCVQTLICTTL